LIKVPSPSSKETDRSPDSLKFDLRPGARGVFIVSSDFAQVWVTRQITQLWATPKLRIFLGYRNWPPAGKYGRFARYVSRPIVKLRAFQNPFRHLFINSTDLALLIAPSSVLVHFGDRAAPLYNVVRSPPTPPSSIIYNNLKPSISKSYDYFL
jgi:hypothetical protein